MTTPHALSPRKPWLLGTGLAVAIIAAIKLLLHLYAGRHYGYFIDELYYLACAQHLQWGYVDQPPLIAFITKAVRITLGDSLPAIRLLPALAGAGKVLLTGLLTRELGGGRFAQGLAALCVLLAPGVLALDALMTMNAFESLFWIGCAYLLIRIVKTGDERLWLWFGVLAGFGLLNKYTMLAFGFSMVAGLLLSRQHRLLLSPWLWVGGTIACLIFLPNLLWNIRNDFPFLELMENLSRSGRNVRFTPVSFFAEETLAMLPLSAPIWIAGLWELFTKPYRALAWAWVITAFLIVTLNPRTYYLFPAFPMLFAAGSVAWERWLARPRLCWIRPVYVTLMVLIGALLAPTMIPLLPPETYIAYSKATHLQQPRVETHKLGPLPQLFADQFGWEEMAATVAGVYNNLPAEVRPKTAIFGYNYGSAGAIDLFGPKYGLPAAISGHQTYYLWGPRGYTGESMIIIGGSQRDLEGQFASVRKVAQVSHPYSMPHHHGDIFYCQGLKLPLNQAWSRVKTWR